MISTSIKLSNFQNGCGGEKLLRQFRTVTLLELDVDLVWSLESFSPVSSHLLLMSFPSLPMGQVRPREISVPCPRSGGSLVTEQGLQPLSAAPPSSWKNWDKRSIKKGPTTKCYLPNFLYTPICSNSLKTYLWLCLVCKMCV